MTDHRSDAELQGLLVANGVSLPGAMQVVTGQLVLNGDDRKKVSELLRKLLLEGGKSVVKRLYVTTAPATNPGDG